LGYYRDLNIMRFYNPQAKEIRSNNMKQLRDIARLHSTTHSNYAADFLKAARADCVLMI